MSNRPNPIINHVVPHDGTVCLRLRRRTGLVAVTHARTTQVTVIEMYILAPGIKEDPVRRWALPDRVFFACGACHILAYAFLDAYPEADFGAVWIKPARGFTGNHIVVVRGDTAFDYHGYSSWSRLLEHTSSKANRWWPGWADEQYLHDAMPRAQQFLGRFAHPPR